MAAPIGVTMGKGRWLYLIGGWAFTGLALLGALLPLLPTTPFLLLAGTCFARSSPKMHERIWNLPVFGQYLRQWEDTHTVPPAAKRKAWLLIGLSFAISIYLSEGYGVNLALLGVGLALMVSVALLPEEPADAIPQAHRSKAEEVECPQVESLDSRQESDGDQGAEGVSQTLDQSQEKLARLSDR